jgi:DNA-binding response OmpR family regulator
MHILIVEDEKDLNKIIVKKLSLEGYTCDSCFDGETALIYLEQETMFDAVIMDIMIPKINGFEVLRRLRLTGSNTPVLLLTARDAVSDRVNGLDLGADDYLVKPFSFDELMARIRMITRKAAGSKTNTLSVLDLQVDVLTKTVTRNNQIIALSAKEFMILEVLIRNKNIVLSRESIESKVSLYDKEINSNVVDVYIRFLRKKIDDDHEIKLIQTVRGSGYVIRDTL